MAFFPSVSYCVCSPKCLKKRYKILLQENKRIQCVLEIDRLILLGEGYVVLYLILALLGQDEIIPCSL